MTATLSPLISNELFGGALRRKEMRIGRKIIQLLFGNWFEGEDPADGVGACGGYMEIDEADDGNSFRLSCRERGIITGMDGRLGKGLMPFQEVFSLKWLNKKHAEESLREFPVGDWAWRKVDALVASGVIAIRQDGDSLIVSLGGTGVAVCALHPQMRSIFQP